MYVLPLHVRVYTCTTGTCLLHVLHVYTSTGTCMLHAVHSYMYMNVLYPTTYKWYTCSWYECHVCTCRLSTVKTFVATYACIKILLTSSISSIQHLDMNDQYLRKYVPWYVQNNSGSYNCWHAVIKRDSLSSLFLFDFID